MTEAVIDGGASAPADTGPAVIDTNANPGPQALGAQTPEGGTDAPAQRDKEAKDMDAVLDRSIAKANEKAAAREADKVKAKEATKAELKPEVKAEVKPDAKPVEKAADKPLQDRNERGQFQHPQGKEPAPEASPEAAKAAEDANQQQTQRWEAPHRFSPEGKEAWETAPDPVKAEVHRAIRELESGLTQHQQRWEPIKQYDELARENGTTVHEALDRYVSMDRLLNQSLPEGLDAIIRDKTGGQAGLGEFIAALNGQQADPAQARHDMTIHELRSELASLKSQLGGVTGTIKQQQAMHVSGEVSAFAADKPHFEALAGRIAEHIGVGMTLPQAYEQAYSDAQSFAQSMGFIAPSGKSATAQPLNPAGANPAPLNPAGTKSVSGSPVTGALTTPRKPGTPLPSIDETLDRVLGR